jgi:hypothetical protein
MAPMKMAGSRIGAGVTGAMTNRHAAPALAHPRQRHPLTRDLDRRPAGEAQHPQCVSGFQRVRVAEGEPWQTHRGHREQCQVLLGVRRHHARCKCLWSVLAREQHLDARDLVAHLHALSQPFAHLLQPLDHVVAGEEQPVRCDREGRAGGEQRLLALVTLGPGAGHLGGDAPDHAHEGGGACGVLGWQRQCRRRQARQQQPKRQPAGPAESLGASHAAHDSRPG